MSTTIGPHLCHALAARQHARRISRLYDARLAPAGLSASQFSILTLLQTYGPLPILDLANLLVMERTSLVRALRPLQAAGWVAADRTTGSRSFDLSLTRHGSNKVSEAMPLWREAQEGLECNVGRDRAKKLRDDILELTR